MRSTLQSMQAQEVAQALSSDAAEFEKLAIWLQSASGEVIYRNVVQIQRWIRGEFHGETQDSEIDRYLFPATSRFFVVRVPLLHAGTHVLQDKESVSVNTFSMSSLLLKSQSHVEEHATEIIQQTVTGIL